MTPPGQRGLTHYLLVLLIVVVAATAGGAGFYLYQRNRQAGSAPADPSITYLPLPGWGVNMHLEKDVRDSYVVDSARPDRTKVVTNPRLAQLAKDVPQCAGVTTVELSRVLPGEVVDGVTYDIEGLEKDISYTKKGDYYYRVTPEPVCEAAGGPADELRRLRDQLAGYALNIMTDADVKQGNHAGHQAEGRR